MTEELPIQSFILFRGAFSGTPTAPSWLAIQHASTRDMRPMGTGLRALG